MPTRQKKAAQAAPDAGLKTPHEKRPRGSGARWAYDEIRTRILTMQLEPGKDFDEQELIKALGMSRTPIREALIQLAAEGLVEILPNRGARVAGLDLAGVRSFFEALDANQRMVTRWAALRHTSKDMERIDEERRRFEAAASARDVGLMRDSNLAFHEAIGAACGNVLVAKHYSQLLALGLRLSRISLAYESGEIGGPEDHVKKIVEDHREMVHHLLSGDADAAEDAARRHTELFRRRVLEYLSASLSTGIRF